MTTSTTWTCALRPELAARADVIRAGMQDALTESLQLLGLAGDGQVVMTTAVPANPGSWAEHNLHGRHVGRNPEPAMRALTLIAPQHRHTGPDWWTTLLDVDDEPLAAFAGWVVRGALQQQPDAALGPDQITAWAARADVHSAEADEQVLAAALVAGRSIGEPEIHQAVRDRLERTAEAADADCGWNPPARRTTQVLLSPGLLRRLTSGGESRAGLFSEILKIFSSRSGIPAPALRTRPDSGLPEPSFTFRSGALREVPYRGLETNEWLATAGTARPERPGDHSTTDAVLDPAQRTGTTVDPTTGELVPRLLAAENGERPRFDASVHVATALLQHLYASAPLFVDATVMSELLDEAAKQLPRLVHRVRSAVGIPALTSIVRGLLQERLGIPCLEAFLQAVLETARVNEKADCRDLLESARRTALPFGVDMIAWGSIRPLPAIYLEIADNSGEIANGWTPDPVAGATEPEELAEAVQRFHAEGGGLTTPSLIVTRPDQLDSIRGTVLPVNPRWNIVAADTLPPGQRLYPGHHLGNPRRAL